ncbi:MAG TPA: hypothetical protein VM869_06010 [Enhygromyxa sp.]|nr:hypothetical protein [Enhygromyxa sp.]
MLLSTDRIISITGLGLLTGISFSALQGCDPDGGTGIPGCDISCPAEGIAEGNAAISGIAEVDAFFGAVIDVSVAANNISSSLRAELDAIALSVDLQPGATGAEIRAAVEAKIGAYVDADAGLKFEFQEPRCEASVEVAVAAAAECDASVEPGSATVECSGGCEVQGGVMASCDANAELTCTGTAPAFDCQGSCEGSCELTVAAGCEGTCRGTCTGDCSVRDSQGNCAGACDGDCQGTCELAAGGTCSGDCTGSCTYKPGDAGCEADASAKCEAMAGGSVQCDGRCEGEVTPPQVKAECEASVEAKANASVECKPPSIEVTWQWAADVELDPMAQAEFKAWLQGFKGRIGVMLAAKAKADILIESLENLGSSGAAAIESATDIVADGDIVGTFKLTSCAIPQLATAADQVTQASQALSVEASASLEVFGALGI